MRKIIVQNMVSVDGYFCRTNGDIDWHIVDDEFNEYAIEFLNQIDTIMFGRVTYKIFEEFWPKALIAQETSPDDRKIAKQIDDATKIVFSKTLESVTWNNSKILKSINKEEIEKLKNQSGKDICIYGSGSIIAELAKFGLIDEYKIIVAPVVIGEGKSFFHGIEKDLNLKLIKSKIFKNGNILLAYSLH